jgi:serine/threonine-protein kinase
MKPTVPDDPERYRRLRDLVDRAAERPEGEWRSFLERACPSDPSLRADALRLLENARAASADGFLAPGSAAATAAYTPTSDDTGLASCPTEPDQVGKYQVVRRFSERSGQGVAYLAADPDLDRHVVLKRYHGGPDAAADEAEEGRALARVASPYVARCHGIERIDGALYLVVEYVPGRNLAEVRRDGPLEPERVVRIVAQVAEGVAAVHARGLIHRDIKPANVILHDDGCPRLVDFGLAAHLGSSRLRDLCGTAPFMAPEQARAEWDRIDQRTDIYGLGALLYELLTGRPPHTGPSLSTILEQAKKGEVTPPRQLDPNIPAPIEAVCLKALAAAPENRYTTAREFAEALRQAIAPPPPRPRPAWVRRGLPAAIVAGALLLLLALTVWLWPRGAKPVAPVAHPVDVAPAAGPIQAELVVRHYKDQGPVRAPMPVGTVSEASLASDPPRLKDLVRVGVALSRPAYGYLIALNPNGKVELCLPVGPPSGSSGRELEFPEDQSDYFGLTDGAGLLAFVLVASDRPLPAFKAWKAQVPGGLEWSPVDREGFWTYDSSAPSEASRVRGRLRGAILHRQAVPDDLIRLCDRLRRSPGVTLVRAVAFPVKPDAEILK